MNRFNIVLFLILINYISENCYSQTPGFSQTTSNFIYVNPAFTGSKNCPRLFTAYRNKYISLENAYVTYFASYDQNVYFLRGDFGITLERDVQGSVFYSHDLSVYYAKGFRIHKKMMMKLGVSGQLFHTSVNTSDLTTPDMIDPVYGFVNASSETYADISQYNFSVSAGILFYSKKMFLGFSSKNLTQPETQNGGILKYRTYLAHLSYKIDVNLSNTLDGLISFHPSVFTEFNKNSGVIQYGIQVHKKMIMGGSWLKQNFDGKYESLVVLIGFVQKKFKFAYTCDISISRYSGAGFDIHELSYTQYLPCKKRKRRFEAIKAPDF